jgi:hypothetical protein
MPPRPAFLGVRASLSSRIEKPQQPSDPLDPIPKPPGPLAVPLSGLSSVQVGGKIPIHSAPSSENSSTAISSAFRPRRSTVSSSPSRAAARTPATGHSVLGCHSPVAHERRHDPSPKWETVGLSTKPGQLQTPDGPIRGHSGSCLGGSHPTPARERRQERGHSCLAPE